MSGRGLLRPADSLQRKLDFIQQNGAQKNPASTPTVMTEEEIIGYVVSTFDSVNVLRPDDGPGAGDSFFIHDNDRRQFPFATIVTKDYGEFDNALTAAAKSDCEEYATSPDAKRNDPLTRMTPARAYSAGEIFCMYK